MVKYSDEFGDYIIPIEKQRPIFLMGAPGIGKTAIMEQVASELGVGLVSYSMTHHTRQSALGLPFIVTKNYGGKEYEVSEYTMSEIIASVYDMIETTGHKEGILFLDEILMFFGATPETLPYAREFMQVILYGTPISYIFIGLNNLMRATGYPRKAMSSALLSVVVNMILAPIFIFIFEAKY